MGCDSSPWGPVRHAGRQVGKVPFSLLSGTAPVMSAILCKLLEKGCGPALVGVGEAGKEDAMGAVVVGEAGHGVGAPTHLAKLSFDGIGGPDFAAVG